MIQTTKDSKPQLASSLVGPAKTGMLPYAAVLTAVVVLLQLALWAPAYNTLVDYPFHLARAWSLHNYDRTPALQAVFERSFAPIPNLAIDLIVPPLLNFMSPVVAGKVFLSLIVVLFALGCHNLAVAVYGRPTWIVPLAAFAVFNSCFLYGFVNSSFSLALFLCTLASWMRFRPVWTPLRWLVVAILATLTYLAHLSGFAFLGLSIAILWLLDFRRLGRIRRNDVLSLAVLAPAVAIQAIPWSSRVQLGGLIEWGFLTKKLIALGSVFLGFRYDLDVAAILLLATAVAIAAFRGEIRLHPGLLTLAAAFLCGSIVCPSQLTPGGGDAADARFVPAGMVFLFLSCTVTCSRRAARFALVLAFAAMLLRFGEVAWNLLRSSAAAEAQIAALKEVNPNSRIYSIFLTPENRQEEKRTRPNLHLASYALILKQSASSDICARRGAQPLFFRSPADWDSRQRPATFDRAYLEQWLPRFDYVWGCHLDPAHRHYLSGRATLVASGDICELWRLDRPR